MTLIKSTPKSNLKTSLFKGFFSDECYALRYHHNSIQFNSKQSLFPHNHHQERKKYRLYRINAESGFQKAGLVKEQRSKTKHERQLADISPQNFISFSFK